MRRTANKFSSPFSVSYRHNYVDASPLRLLEDGYLNQSGGGRRRARGRHKGVYFTSSARRAAAAPATEGPVLYAGLSRIGRALLTTVTTNKMTNIGTDDLTPVFEAQEEWFRDRETEGACFNVAVKSFVDMI
ncbi:hypothetical protein EVAR_67587_1 [Eumeta japonica]|uniref:Uncharacterized protein n=1 Tax=Eumeta variegata TaxID=151549 RepID=A0A4C2A4V3_EUMVA|nr:hypothetical protein EVAR_67587_1 [Eumeta japonica]